MAAGWQFCPQCAEPLEWREQAGRERRSCDGCGFVHWDNPLPVLAALVGHGPGDWSRRGEKFHEPSAEVLYGPRAEEYAHWGAPVAGIRLVGTMPVAIPAWCACRVDPMVALRQD